MDEFTNPHSINETEATFDLTFRPESIDEYFMEGRVKPDFYESLRVFLHAARDRNEALEHVLFFGPPGLGKTTLAYILAKELQSEVKITSGPAIERAGDLISILTNLKDRDILFIDEIHRLNKVIEETMYPAMENYNIDIVLGKGPSARSVRLNLPKVTIVGATTKIGSMSAPLRDRFGMHYRLEFYSPDELEQIVKRSAKLMGMQITPDACTQIAWRSRGTPRLANRLLRRVRDFAQIHQASPITEKVINRALDMLQIDLKGLNAQDRMYLTNLAEKFSGGPVGLETIAASISEDKNTIEEVVEPYLLQTGFIQRTQRGRVLTPQGYLHIGIKPSENG